MQLKIDVISDILKEINYMQQKLSKYKIQRLSPFDPLIYLFLKKKNQPPLPPEKPLVLETNLNFHLCSKEFVFMSQGLGLAYCSLAF